MLIGGLQALATLPEELGPASQSPAVPPIAYYEAMSQNNSSGNSTSKSGHI